MSDVAVIGCAGIAVYVFLSTLLSKFPTFDLLYRNQSINCFQLHPVTGRTDGKETARRQLRGFANF